MKIAQSRVILHNGWSGEIDLTMEKPRPSKCVIRSVR